MAYDYGSLHLEIKNPFKLIGWTTAFRGGLMLALGIFLLFLAIGEVRENVGSAWVEVVSGIFFLGVGVKALGGGIYETLRYFVGRSQPTSLSKNCSKHAGQWAEEESHIVKYSEATLEEMLMGRKNITFVEPKGLLARLLHSLIPNLLFLPYPMRNLAQRLFSVWIRTIFALLAYGFVVFVSLTGLAGDLGEILMPVFSLMLVCYLIVVWMAQGRAFSRNVETQVESLDSGVIVKCLTGSILLPAAAGLALSWLATKGDISQARIDAWLGYLPSAHINYYLFGISTVALLVSLQVVFLLRCRLTRANPATEVSELRENWQETIHPNEIFISLDNLVMANRRYKEVPNRIYVALDPQMVQQVQGKGKFWGKMIQEVQPRVKPVEEVSGFNLARIFGLLTGNILHFGALALLLLLTFSIAEMYQLSAQDAQWSSDLFTVRSEFTITDLAVRSAHYLIVAILLFSYARFLLNATRLFYAEIQFESLLIYLQCEGTFSESKISTGTGIYDSTRSENVLVRSSITPWIIISRIVSSTFASSGLKNLEYPRYILEMHRADNDLACIREDMIAFLKDRESIASITSIRDLDNASRIFQLNQQTRAEMPQRNMLERDAEVAGYIQCDKPQEGIDVFDDNTESI